MHFDSVIDDQQYTQAKLNNDYECYSLECKTPLALERHTSSIYTKTIFYDVQFEICVACFFFFFHVVNVQECDDRLYYEIKDGGKHAFKVIHVVDENNASCSPIMFERIGLLCNHLFFGCLRTLACIIFLLKFLLGQWSKDASLRLVSNIDGDVLNQYVEVEEMNVVTINL